ncbi:MAG: hypothetical protein R3Y07_07595 [Eubacteriales bacterium]
MDNFDNNELDTVFVQQLDTKTIWQCTPFLVLLYFFVFCSGYLSFTIANGVALFAETGIWQVPEPVLEFSGKSHTWYSNFSSNNYFASMLHIFSCSTMVYYDSAMGNDRKSAIIFGLISIFQIYSAINGQILDAERFTTETLQTSDGISLMEHIFVGIWTIQVILTVILLFVRFILGISIIKLPKVRSNYQIAAYFFLPIVIPMCIQFFLYEMSLSTTEILLILIGIVGVYFIQWERNRG